MGCTAVDACVSEFGVRCVTVRGARLPELLVLYLRSQDKAKNAFIADYFFFFISFHGKADPAIAIETTTTTAVAFHFEFFVFFFCSFSSIFSRAIRRKIQIEKFVCVFFVRRCCKMVLTIKTRGTWKST